MWGGAIGMESKDASNISLFLSFRHATHSMAVDLEKYHPTTLRAQRGRTISRCSLAIARVSRAYTNEALSPLLDHTVPTCTASHHLDIH
jgi:hypothetical protein